MGLWLTVFGLALAAAVVPALRRSSSSTARTLLMDVLPIPDRDAEPHAHLRSARQLALASILAWTAGLILAGIGDHWQLHTPPNTAFSIVALVFFFFGVFTLWLLVRGLFRAVRAKWRARRSFDPSSGRAGLP